jgi:hypothetical protein
MNASKSQFLFTYATQVLLCKPNSLVRSWCGHGKKESNNTHITTSPNMRLGPTKVELHLRILWNLIEFGIPVEQVARWSANYDTSNFKPAGVPVLHRIIVMQCTVTCKTKILIPPQIGLAVRSSPYVFMVFYFNFLSFLSIFLSFLPSVLLFLSIS